jgi:hypothetical protein
VYAAAWLANELAVLTRDTGTGRLSLAEWHADGVAGVDGLAGARDLAPSPDSRHLYAAGRDDDAVAAFRTSFVPTLVIDRVDGGPGSFFTLWGFDFPANGWADIQINGVAQPNPLPVSNLGQFVFMLDTSQADPGFYWITASVNPSASASFRLEPNGPLRPPSGNWPIFHVPSGIAWELTWLPVVAR